MNTARQIGLFLTLVLTAGLITSPLSAAEKKKRAEVNDAQGNYLGEWKLRDGGGGKLTCQIVGLGNGTYRAIFTAYDGSEQENRTFQFPISGTSVSETKVVFATQVLAGADLGTFAWKTELEAGRLMGDFSNEKNYIGTMELKRIELPVSMLGIAPPEGGRKLLQEAPLADWNLAELPTGSWLFEDGVLTVGASAPGEPRHLALKTPHESGQIHLEFRLPYQPASRGQDRGQSGLWLQGLYEIQIVDSFGAGRTTDNFGAFDDLDALGSVLGQKAPSDLPALPPGEWQALDIQFVPPKLAADGTVESPGEVTVRLNDVLIQDRTPLEKPTEGAPRAGQTPAGLVLQHAGSPVEFRNLWFVATP
jgi:hypothetical protein